MKEIKGLKEVKERVARTIATICGENYDAYNDEDRESCLWWADQILSFKGKNWRMALIKHPVQGESLEGYSIVKVIWSAE